jgi:DNA mismatch endonuclease (patch repair protein)
LIFPRSRTVVFVDGCFWHGCPEHGPKSTAFRGPNAERWQVKLADNRARDERATGELQAAGWFVIRVWECEVKRDVEGTAERIRAVVRGKGTDGRGTGPSGA